MVCEQKGSHRKVQRETGEEPLIAHWTTIVHGHSCSWRAPDCHVPRSWKCRGPLGPDHSSQALLIYLFSFVTFCVHGQTASARQTLASGQYLFSQEPVLVLKEPTAHVLCNHLASRTYTSHFFPLLPNIATPSI